MATAFGNHANPPLIATGFACFVHRSIAALGAIFWVALLFIWH